MFFEIKIHSGKKKFTPTPFWISLPQLQKQTTTRSHGLTATHTYFSFTDMWGGCRLAVLPEFSWTRWRWASDLVKGLYVSTLWYWSWRSTDNLGEWQVLGQVETCHVAESLSSELAHWFIISTYIPLVCSQLVHSREGAGQHPPSTVGGKRSACLMPIPS